MKVRDLMTTNVTTADLNSSVTEIAKSMRDFNVGSIPVCDRNDNLVGIVTDRDIVLRNVAEGGRRKNKAQDVMSSKLITVTPDTHVHEAARIMAENQIRRLPVVENGRLVGIVSIGDFATQNIYVNEAGDALSEISRPSRPMQ